MSGQGSSSGSKRPRVDYEASGRRSGRTTGPDPAAAIASTISEPSKSTLQQRNQKSAEKGLERLALIPLTDYSLPASALPGTRLKELQDFRCKLDSIALNANGGNDTEHWQNTWKVGGKSTAQERDESWNALKLRKS